MNERLHVGAGAILLLLVGLACRASGSRSNRTSDASPESIAALSDPPGRRVVRVCERLVDAGVAKNCGQPTDDGTGSMVKFDVLAFADERGTVQTWGEGDTKVEQLLNLVVRADLPADDYPESFIFSREHRLLVTPGLVPLWRSCLTANGCSHTDENATDLRCSSQVYAACAKQYSKQYAKAKSFNESAAKAVSEP